MVSSYRVLNDLISSFFQFDLQNLIEVQDGVVCLADLQEPIGHPCDSPSRENAFFFWCSFSLNEEPSCEVSVDDLLETTRSLLAARVTVNDVFRSATDFVDSTSLIHTIAAIERLAREDTALLKFNRRILKIQKSRQASNSSCSASEFWEVVSLTTCSGTLNMFAAVGEGREEGRRREEGEGGEEGIFRTCSKF